ncbi:MAG: small conductance mechanosensitive channel [Desulforhopalus sp.]|jgi:small conductance mechanosensitive channel
MNFAIDPEMIKNLQPLVIAWGGKAFAALLIFLIGKWIARKITNVLITLMKSRDVDVTLIKFLQGIVYYALLASVVIAAAGQLGIKTTSFLAVLGAASLAIGLALKDSLANFSSGVMLILFHPFKVGDVVTIGGETGTVEAISVFSTILNTGDNQKKIIPNGTISNATITNITANPTRRVDLVIGIGYDDDIRKAKETLEEILAADARILKDPAPTVAVSALGASSVDLVVRPWVATGDYWGVYFSLTEKIKLTFDEKNISFPYPQQDVHLIQTAE